ncbi:MAG: D-alanyl-D-alanine carboxypeptidase family protein [Litorimonas sp.]
MFRPLSLFTACLFLSVPAYAQSSFQTEAPHAVIIDAETGEVLFEKDARNPMPPASMTKIMTAQLVFDALKEGTLSLETEFQVSEDAWRRGGFASGSSTMALDVNSTVSVENLIRGVIVQSGNDACIVLAQGMAGSEAAFAEQMTTRAKELGLTNATFQNATGWPEPPNRISALDLAKLAQKQIEMHPEFYPLYAEREFTWNNTRQFNRNPLLGRVRGADGLKTGATEESGYGLVGSAKRGDDRRIIVINGLESQSARRNVATTLMEAAFLQFRVYDLHAQGDVLGEVEVYMGKAPFVEVALTENIRKGLPVADRKKVKSEIVYTSVKAPITKGDVVAELRISLPGRPEVTYDLVATADVKRKGLFSRAWTGLLSNIRGE